MTEACQPNFLFSGKYKYNFFYSHFCQDFYGLECMQHCFLCRLSFSTVSEDAGTVATLTWQSYAIITRLDLINDSGNSHPRLRQISSQKTSFCLVLSNKGQAGVTLLWISIVNMWTAWSTKKTYTIKYEFWYCLHHEIERSVKGLLYTVVGSNNCSFSLPNGRNWVKTGLFFHDLVLSKLSTQQACNPSL